MPTQEYKFGSLFTCCDDACDCNSNPDDLPSRIHLPNWLSNNEKHVSTPQKYRQRMKEIVVTSSSKIRIVFESPFYHPQILTYHHQNGFSLSDVVDCIARGYRMLFDESHRWMNDMVHMGNPRQNVTLFDTTCYRFEDMYLEHISFNDKKNEVVFCYSS